MQSIRGTAGAGRWQRELRAVGLLAGMLGAAGCGDFSIGSLGVGGTTPTPTGAAQMTGRAKVALVSYEQDETACTTTACYSVTGMSDPEVNHFVLGLDQSCWGSVIQLTKDGQTVLSPNRGRIVHPTCGAMDGVKFDESLGLGETATVCVALRGLLPRSTITFRLETGSDCSDHIVSGARCIDGEICDGLDNDCNGWTDDQLAGENVACQTGMAGACAKGMMQCLDGEYQCLPREGDCRGECVPRREDCLTDVDEDCDTLVGCEDPDCTDYPGCEACVPAAEVEICGNGMDDDCDEATDCEDSACADTPYCCNPNACGDCGPPPIEICDGQDNDCDGDVDEGVTNACGGCGDVPAEVCDGSDNDCDGQTDEGLTNACGGCGPVPKEVCDGKDNDCDGKTDEGVKNACGTCGAVPKEVCDGRDNDCDGQVDEGMQKTISVDVPNCNDSWGNDYDACMAKGDWAGCSYRELQGWCSRRDPGFGSGTGSLWYRVNMEAVDRACDGTVQYISGGGPNGKDVYQCYSPTTCNTYWSETPLVLSFEPERNVEYHEDDGLASFDLSRPGAPAAIRTDWPTEATPWLAIDRDGDGTISSGAELFGSATPIAGGYANDGFAALAQLDDDDDGVLTERDPAFARLRLWADIDADRVSTANELKTLSELGIVELEVRYDIAPRCDERGNCEIERASFSWMDEMGVLRRGAIIDIHLAVRPSRTSRSFATGPTASWLATRYATEPFTGRRTRSEHRSPPYPPPRLRCCRAGG